MLETLTSESAAKVNTAVGLMEPRFEAAEVGTVLSVGRGIARVDGLPGVEADELVRFNNAGRGGEGTLGFAFNIDPEELGIIVLGDHATLAAGMEVRRCGRVMDLPVGDALLGRVIDATGRPLDERGKIAVREPRRIEVDAPAIMDRAPVTAPLQTGLKAIDALIPIGRGQRELILGDRQTGKTAVAVDTIVNQRDKDVVCVYCAVGQRNAAVASVIDNLREYGALDHTLVVVASCEDAAGLQFIAPYAATAAAEHFMHSGRDVLVVYDDLTKHARAYRQLSLLLRRPPGREAYPGDIFYVHSRLLERATHLRDSEGGGSLTALPIIETEAQNIAAYIPTNLISITDGQVYLSPDLFRKGQLPAVDIGKSVSRVGGKAQLKAYRDVASDLRLSYSQFEELERFSRFGTRLDEDTRRTLQHGRRVRAILKQAQFSPLPVPEQIGALLAVAEGILDDVPLEQVSAIEEAVARRLRQEHEEACRRIMEGDKLTDDDRAAILALARDVVKETTDADSGTHETED